MRTARQSKDRIKRKRCWAVTKNFRRCNTQRTQLFFCREHRQLKYIVPIVIAIFTLLSSFASIESAWLRTSVSPNKASVASNEITQKDGTANKDTGDGPFAIQPLWLYQKPPVPKFGDHDGTDLMDGFELILALRILNRTDKQILISDFQYTWWILNPISAYEDFNKTSLTTQTFLDQDSGKELSLREILEGLQGGYIHGSALTPFYVYKDESDLAEATENKFTPKSFSNQAWRPFKLEPYQELFIQLRVELEIHMKDGKHFALNLKGKKDTEEFHKLLPLFFGAKNVNDVERTFYLVIQSSAGREAYELKDVFWFSGASFYVPKEYLNTAPKK